MEPYKETDHWAALRNTQAANREENLAREFYHRCMLAKGFQRIAVQ
jgi:hypothetical protein